MVDDSLDPPIWQGQPVDGFTEELDRRGEAKVYGCGVVGCTGDHPDHGTS